MTTVKKQPSNKPLFFKPKFQKSLFITLIYIALFAVVFFTLKGLYQSDFSTKDEAKRIESIK